MSTPVTAVSPITSTHVETDAGTRLDDTSGGALVDADADALDSGSSADDAAGSLVDADVDTANSGFSDSECSSFNTSLNLSSAPKSHR